MDDDDGGSADDAFMRFDPHAYLAVAPPNVRAHLRQANVVVARAPAAIEWHGGGGGGVPLSLAEAAGVFVRRTEDDDRVAEAVADQFCEHVLTRLVGDATLAVWAAACDHTARTLWAQLFHCVMFEPLQVELARDTLRLWAGAPFDVQRAQCDAEAWRVLEHVLRQPAVFFDTVRLLPVGQGVELRGFRFDRRWSESPHRETLFRRVFFASICFAPGLRAPGDAREQVLHRVAARARVVCGAIQECAQRFLCRAAGDRAVLHTCEVARYELLRQHLTDLNRPENITAFTDTLYYGSPGRQ